MSPAKRKSAKPGRAASVAARAGKARGKAPGSALAKAVKVKGKTPAKGKDHRLAARNGAKNGKGIACDMPREQLELLLDRDGGRDDVLTHVPACHPCTTSLTVIASQRDAIRHLTAEPGGTAVEYLLERGARAGERKLADLVYELAKACLVVVKDIDRRVHLAMRPREQDEIGRDVRGVARRMMNGAHSAVESRLPQSLPDEANALVAAESCIAILERLEGATERQRLSRAVWLINSSQPSAAETLLSAMLDAALPEPLRLHAYHNLLWALLLQRKYEAVVRAGETCLREFPSDWICNYNITAASACLGERRRFESAAKKLRSLDNGVRGERAFRHGLLRFEVRHFAESLGLGHAEVARALGVDAADLVGAHEAR